MARPARNNAEYFTHNADFRNDRRIKAIRARLGAAGYGLVLMLLEVLTDSDYTQLSTDELELELLSGDLGVSVTEIDSLLQIAEKIGFFARNEGGFLICPDLNKALEPVFEKRNRARNAIQTGKNTIVATETGVSVTETPQSKVKESKVNDTEVSEKVKEKENTEDQGENAQARPPEIKTIPVEEDPSDFNSQPLTAKKEKASHTGGVAAAKTEEIPNWHRLFTDTYCDFYKTRVGVAPKFTQRDGMQAAELREYLKSQCRGQTDEGAQKTLQYIFHHWNRLEPFLQDQLTLTQINKNINNILNQVKNGAAKHNNSGQKTGNGANVDAETAVALSRSFASN